MNNDTIIISKNTVLAFLLLSALFLSCTWALVGGITGGPVGSTARAGYYIVTSTSSPKLAPDLLWVANIDTQVLAVYGTSTDGVITPLTMTNLNAAFEMRRMPNGRMPLNVVPPKP
ncbi:MAG: hypothetical protein K9M57_05330 [Phycisphaerae bacterium]|nr:hypothetical protein [Phycisphaerae bacterium]